MRCPTPHSLAHLDQPLASGPTDHIGPAASTHTKASSRKFHQPSRCSQRPTLVQRAAPCGPRLARGPAMWLDRLAPPSPAQLASDLEGKPPHHHPPVPGSEPLRCVRIRSTTLVHLLHKLVRLPSRITGAGKATL
ncbi:uncharacterized protein LOC123410386 [Hordeum vulgare subsp. vulgare]|uniref:uncharacterized protein LOC123410386 n=1 Tax=Hordeum vulgare subsp. vulgare TaxID=112509 RepID=UPI001D1A55AA|nr:uncharacterized protein LOC123410386 [Hordeum vulgare subsp. vulgare]